VSWIKSWLGGLLHGLLVAPAVAQLRVIGVASSVPAIAPTGRLDAYELGFDVERSVGLAGFSASSAVSANAVPAPG
jgi:hypothetical protein